MTIRALLFSLLGLVILLGLHYAGVVTLPFLENHQEEVEWQPHEMPSVEIQRLNGEALNLDGLKGKIILLNFWVSNCAPCIEEFPSLLALAQKFPKDLVLVAVSTDGSRQAIEKFLQGHGSSYQTAQKNQNVILAWDQTLKLSQDHFNVMRFPETFIVSREFKIVKKVVGASEWDSPEMTDFIRKLF